MPRILRIINRFNLGGITFNVANLSKHLAPAYETLLIGGEKEVNEDSSLFIAEEMGLKPMILPEMTRAISLSGDIRAYRRIRTIIREFKPDIVHTHAAKAGAVGRWAAWKEKVPVIVHTFHGHVFHSYFNSLKTEFYKSIERNLARKSNAIIAISEKQKLELVEQYRICAPEKVHVIPLGFDLTRFQNCLPESGKEFRKKWKIAEDRIVISIVGRLVPIKNHALFLEAISQLAQRYPGKITGLIVGDGSERAALTRLSEELKLKPEELIFTSWIRHTEDVYAASDITVLTSFNEGTPVSLVEALASAVPVVSAQVGGVENIVSRENGLLFPSGDLTVFIEHLDRLIRNEALRKKMGDAGRISTSDKYHFSRLISETDKLYQTLLGCSR